MGQTSSKKQHRKSSMPVFNETPLPQQEKKKEQFESPRAKEVEELLSLATSHLIPWIASADDKNGALVVDALPPKKLESVLNLGLPDGAGKGKEGLEEAMKKVLRYSVNTWRDGFMDKLYASTDPVGIASDLLLSVLNTNVHVYQVSPALTIIERETAQKFARLFGFDGPHAGGITLPGGSASNSTSMIIAKNTLFPETKIHGNGDKKFVVFSSIHGHYSVEKAAILLGLGSGAVWEVPVDKQGRMIAADLESMVIDAKEKGFTPFYVNAGAGTTVFGSYDPFDEIAEICKRHGMWFHIDGSWGGAVVFSESQKWRMSGAHKANSLTVNPHKMLGVPVTCSFLLAPDRRQFHRAVSLKAGYLFHEQDDDEEEDVYDMAQMTMGCGRRADSLKMALSWIYYGKEGYERRIDHAFDMAKYFATTIENTSGFHLVSENPPPCLQVCFYYTGPSNKLSDNAKFNTEATRRIAAQLVAKGYMVDYSPHPTHGEFFRAVVSSRTTKDTVDNLVAAIEKLGNI